MDNREKIINYEFKDIKLLDKAFVHSSFANVSKEPMECNERLEFLGDAVLQLIISEYLFNDYNEREGVLSKKRIELVCKSHLYEVAKTLRLNKYLLTSNGANNIKDNPSVLADMIEAIIGAIYLDGGYENAKKFIQQFIIKENNDFIDYKSKAIEYIQSLGYEPPNYNKISEKGPEHDKIFIYELEIPNSTKKYKGIGKTKKEAQQIASKCFLKDINKKSDV